MSGPGDHEAASKGDDPTDVEVEVTTTEVPDTPKAAKPKTAKGGKADKSGKTK